MTTAVLDSEQARIDGLLDSLRAAEAEYRRSYARVLDVVAELDTERAGAITGFGTTARLMSGVLNLSPGEARVRVEHAEVLTPRRSLTGQNLPPALPATAAELAAGAIGPSHLRVITATMRRIPPTTHPDAITQAEQTLAHMARRFDPPALSRIAERLLAHLDPTAPHPTTNPSGSGSCGSGPEPTGPSAWPGPSTPKAAPASGKSWAPSTSAVPRSTGSLTSAAPPAATPTPWSRP